MSQAPQVVVTTIDQWFDQRYEAMESGLDDLWKEELVDEMDSAARVASMKKVMGWLFITPKLQHAWEKLIEPALDEAWEAAVFNPKLLTHQDEVKKLLEQERKELRRLALQTAEQRWAAYQDKGDVRSFTQGLIFEIFDRQHIDTSVPDAYRIDDASMREDIKQLIRLEWLKARHASALNKDISSSEKELFWSLYREVLRRTAGDPGKVNHVWMTGLSGAVRRSKEDVMKFYRSREYLIRAAGPSRIILVNHQVGRYRGLRAIHWKGHTFTMHQVTGLTQMDEERKAKQLASHAGRLI